MVGKNKGKWNVNTEIGRKNLIKLEGLVQSGYTDKEIAQEYGLKESYVPVLRDRLKKLGFDVGKYTTKNTIPKVKNGKVAKSGKSDSEDLGTRTKQLFGGTEHEIPGLLQLSDEELFFYRENPADFAKKCVLWHGNPLILDDYQIKWIIDDSKFKIANKSRRIGFSFATAFKAFHKALFFPGSTELFVSIKEDRAKELMDYVYTFADSNPDLFEGLFIERARLQCYLSNGSRIYSLSNSPSGVRGIPQIKDVDVHIDEFAHFKTGGDKKLYQALIASVSLGGTMSVWSTPFGKRGLFYDIWFKADPNHSQFNGFSKHEVPWWECSRLDKDAIEGIKRATDPVTFRQEFCCDFVSSGSELFREDDILTAQEDHIISKGAVGDNPYYFGVDFAQKHDSTAIIISEFTGTSYIIRHLEELKGRGIEFIIPVIKSLHSKFGPSCIYCDETGMGIPLVRALQTELGSVVQGVSFSNQTKDRLIMSLWSLFNDGKIKIPPHEGLKNQLMRMERQETATGSPKYTGKIDGFKDDLVWALALACSSDNRKWSGFVSLGDTTSLDDIVDDMMNFA